MNDMAPSREERIEGLKGLGTSRKRVEDARFTQGKGNYVDDVKMPGMLFMDVVRSPYAHARIESIDVNPVVIIEISIPCLASCACALGRSRSTFSGRTWPLGRVVKSTPGMPISLRVLPRSE